MLWRFFGSLIVWYGSNLPAETLQVSVMDQAGQAVSDAVVYAQSESPDASWQQNPTQPVVIDQIDKTFRNPVTVIRPGTSVIFPNHDQIRHHVYSFSPVKTFELPLYKDVTPEPVRFDQPGVIALGCNIHDWMFAYILVVDSPFTGLTGDDGHARLTLPQGSYQVKVWHPRLKTQEESNPYRVDIPGQPPDLLSVTVALKKNLKSVARMATNGFEAGTYR